MNPGVYAVPEYNVNARISVKKLNQGVTKCGAFRIRGTVKTVKRQAQRYAVGQRLTVCQRPVKENMGRGLAGRRDAGPLIMPFPGLGAATCPHAYPDVMPAWDALMHTLHGMLESAYAPSPAGRATYLGKCSEL